MSSATQPTPSYSLTAHDLMTTGDISLRLGMHDAYHQLDHQPLRQVLLETLDAERDSVRSIARSFGAFLSTLQDVDVRRRFFATWQKTNNSAMSVEGLANRITAEAEAHANNGQPGEALTLFRAAGRMNRVADEDLGVGGQALHAELYYRMATALAGEDDYWQGRAYCLPVASEFKAWLDFARLRSPVLVGLYSLLVHEGYTHAEVETIVRPFHTWAAAQVGLPEHEARRVLAWITVHCGGTEKAHFAHATASFNHYLAGSGAEIDLEIARETFRKYFQLKGAVMRQLAESYR